MGEDLRTTRFDQVADIKWGDTKTTKSSYRESGYLAYSASGPDGFLDHYDFNGPGVVVSAIGAQCGKSWFASGKWSCIKNTIRIIGKEGISDTRFLSYVVQTPGFFSNRGSAQPFLSQGDIQSKEVTLPELPTQQNIAQLLGNFDDLIETNLKLIQHLKSLCSTLVKYELSGSSDFVSIADAASFENSRRKPLSAAQRQKIPGEFPYYGATGQMDSVNDYLFDGVRVLVGEDGSVERKNGTPFVQLVEGQYWVSNHAHVLSGKSMSTYALRAILEQTVISHLVTGAVQPKLSMGMFKSLMIMQPSPELMNQINAFSDAELELQREVRQLSAVRDALLPLLVSGAVLVNSETVLP